MKVTLKHPVSDKGYMWEATLFCLGFNKLPSEQQYGKVVEDGLYPYKIHWPAVNIETLCYKGEVCFEIPHY